MRTLTFAQSKAGSLVNIQQSSTTHLTGNSHSSTSKLSFHTQRLGKVGKEEQYVNRIDLHLIHIIIACLDVSIHLSVPEVGMPQPFADLIQRHASHSQLRRESVTRHVRCDRALSLLQRDLAVL